MFREDKGVLTIKEMRGEGYRPAYKPVQVQTAEGMLETWQMLPLPEEIPAEEREKQATEEQPQVNVLQFPEKRKQAA